MGISSPREQLSQAIHLRYFVLIKDSLRKTAHLKYFSHSETSGRETRKKRFVCVGHKLNVKLVQSQLNSMTSTQWFSTNASPGLRDAVGDDKSPFYHEATEKNQKNILTCIDSNGWFRVSNSTHMSVRVAGSCRTCGEAVQTQWEHANSTVKNLRPQTCDFLAVSPQCPSLRLCIHQWQ